MREPKQRSKLGSQEIDSSLLLIQQVGELSTNPGPGYGKQRHLRQLQLSFDLLPPLRADAHSLNNSIHLDAENQQKGLRGSNILRIAPGAGTQKHIQRRA